MGKNANQSSYQQNREIGLYTLIQNIINQKMFVNIGIITKVHNDNLIDVKLYRSNVDGSDIELGAVRLLHLGTDKFRITVQPAIGDNVLILANQDFIGELENNHDANLDEPVVLPYSNATLQAILISPEKEDNQDDLLTTIDVDKNGNIDVKSQGCIKATVIDQDGKDQECVEVGTEKIVLTDTKNGNTVTLDENGISATNDTDGLFDVGNSVGTLGGLMAELIDEIVGLKTFGSPAQHSVMPDNIAKLNALKQKCGQVFKQ